VSRRKIAWIVVGVIVAHFAAFLLIAHINPLSKTPFIAPPNFGFKQTTYVDPVSGEKTIEREFRVSTKLAQPGTYEGQQKIEEEKSKPEVARQ
jgi:hypothetical protein